MKRIVGTVLVFVGIAILGWLGTWQYSRYLDKAAFEEIRDARAERPPVQLNRKLNADEDHMRQFFIDGQWLETRHVIKHRIRDGKPGFWLVVPFKTAFETVLVRVGWFPFDKKVEEGEVIALPEPPLHGMAYTPDRIINDPAPTAVGALEVWSTFDAASIMEGVGNQKTFIWLDESHARPPYPLTSLKDISEPFLTSDKHLGYAATWYGLGLALLCLFVGVEVRRYKRRTRT